MQVTIADHPVLEMLNTVMLVEGQRVDAIATDEDVLRWLAATGWPAPARFAGRGSPAQTFRALREEIRNLIESRKAGKRVYLSTLNTFLAAARSSMKLAQEKNGDLRAARVWEQRTAKELLAPVAEGAAELLAAGDFELIRKCENEECVLWFYDRTKSHHRRWCSMAVCGNRHKVTAFRRRRLAGQATIENVYVD